MKGDDKLKCGECGGDKFKLYARGGECRFGGQGSGGFRGELVVECVGCRRCTVVSAAAPALVTDPEGPLCGGWGK